MKELALGNTVSLNLMKIKEVFKEDLDKVVMARVKKLLESTLKLEQEHYLELEPYEHAGAGRKDYRNGGYLRSFKSYLGLICEVEVPRCRRKGFRSRVSWYAGTLIDQVHKSILKMFLTGTSTRKVGEVMQTMLGFSVSSSYVSGVCKELDKEVVHYHKRKLEDRYRYLFLDGIYLKNKEVLKSRKKAILVAYGIKHEGQRELIDFQVAKSESQAAWQGFLERLKLRGLLGENLELIIIDGGKGLLSALEWIYGHVKVQRCWAHKMRNVANYLPKRYEQQCTQEAEAIYRAENRRAATKTFKSWKLRWQALVPKAVECIEKDLEELLHFFDFPKSHWKKIRTTNIIERCFREVRRRTHSMGVLPNVESTQRIVYSLFAYFNRRWQSKHRYIKTIQTTLNKAA